MPDLAPLAAHRGGVAVLELGPGLWLDFGRSFPSSLRLSGWPSSGDQGTGMLSFCSLPWWMECWGRFAQGVFFSNKLSGALCWADLKALSSFPCCHGDGKDGEVGFALELPGACAPTEVKVHIDSQPRPSWAGATFGLLQHQCWWLLRPSVSISFCPELHYYSSDVTHRIH